MEFIPKCVQLLRMLCVCCCMTSVTSHEYLPPCSPPAHVVATSVHYILPVLATIPGTDHNFTPFTSHPSPFSPSLVDVGKMREALEMSLEQLPLPLPLRGAHGARTGDLLDRALPICRQLPSAEQYRAFALYKVCDCNISTLIFGGWGPAPRIIVLKSSVLWLGENNFLRSCDLIANILNGADGPVAGRNLSVISNGPEYTHN